GCLQEEAAPCALCTMATTSGCLAAAPSATRRATAAGSAAATACNVAFSSSLNACVAASSFGASLVSVAVKSLYGLSAAPSFAVTPSLSPVASLATARSFAASLLAGGVSVGLPL